MFPLLFSVAEGFCVERMNSKLLIAGGVRALFSQSLTPFVRSAEGETKVPFLLPALTLRSSVGTKERLSQHFSFHMTSEAWGWS